MRGRRPLPTTLKLVKGTARKCRENPNEPMPTPALPSPPSFLDEVAVEEWNRVAPGLYQICLLSEMDRGALVGYCASYSRGVHAEALLIGMAGTPMGRLVVRSRQMSDSKPPDRDRQQVLVGNDAVRRRAWNDAFQPITD